MDGDDPLTRPGAKRGSARWTRSPLFAGLTLVAAALGGWVLCGRDQSGALDETVTAGEPASPAPTPPVSPPPPTPSPTPRSRPPAVQAKGASEEVPEEFPPSHPITPHHERIALQNRLIQRLNDAMDLRDGAQLRQLATHYREQQFDDADKLAEGYEIVANCLERPGAESHAAARAFFNRERGSILRRQVHRHCLQ